MPGSCSRVMSWIPSSQRIVGVVLSLLTWPLGDAAAERRAVERFVEPVFRIRDSR
nr:hypothetical protein JVH1_3248 [Rhodococcus sp. JVH1]